MRVRGAAGVPWWRMPGAASSRGDGRPCSCGDIRGGPATTVLAAWIGPPRGSIQKLQTLDALPGALVRWHEQVSAWGYSAVVHQNEVPAECRMDGDVLLVGIENQAFWVWGVREPSEDNPWVVERENDERAEWTDVDERLDEFLWHFTLIEAVMGAPHGCWAMGVGWQQLARFTKGWTAVDVKGWRWPAQQQSFWTRYGLLAWTMARG